MSKPLKMSVCRQFSHRTSVSNVIQWAEVSNSAYYYRHKANRPGRKPTMYTLKEDGTVVANEEVINDIKRTLQIEFVCYGYLPMTRELNGLGYLINHKKVYRIMRNVMSYLRFWFVSQIKCVDLKDFLPKPANDNWVSPMKSRVEFW